ncbi:AAA family ATPase [Salinibacter ruber]|uniref:AAA family ATPase n=1 Tax=Salinibacter ruber TaxID=146919 RepID=UPI000C9F03EA|nr:AAA family ATPase [Salinibacter ruber]
MPPSEQPSEPTPSSDVLRFQQLRVNRFNGIEHGLEVELCDGVNVIHGSNAAGKTTLAHAIRGLLWPEHVGEQLPIVDARFVLDGSIWRVELEGKDSGYTRDQSPASRPSLPPAAHGPRYHLYLHDLLGGGDDEESFAQRILKEAQGGIDIEGTAEELEFEVPSRRTAQITNTVQDLREKRDKTKENQEALRRREQTLDDLREKKDEAERAARQASALEQAIEVASARQTHDEAEAALDQFPDVMDEVQGDEDEQLDSLREKQREAENEIQEAEDQIEDARETIEESRIPEDGLPEGRVEELREVVSSIREQEREVREYRSEVTEAEEEEESAWGRLPAGVDKDAATGIDLPELEKIETHVKAVEDVQGQRTAFETAKDLFEADDSDTPIDTLRDGLKHLHRWLQFSGAATRSDPGWLQWTILIGGLLVAGGGAFLGILGTGMVTGVGIGLAVLGVLIAAAEGWRRRQAGEESSGQRALHEREYERLGLDEPNDWSRSAVEEHADTLLDELRKAHVVAEKQDTWTRLQSEYEDLDATEEKLEEERQRLAEELGFDPDVGSLSLPVLLDRLSRWQAAFDEVDAKQAALETAKDEAERCRERLNDALEEYELGPIDNASEAEGAVSTLEAARNEFQEAERDLEQAENQKKDAIQDRDDAESDIEDLYDRLNLEQGAEDELRNLAGQRKAYKEAIEEERDAEATLEAELRQLRRMEAHEEQMEEATKEELQRRLDTAEETAEKEEEYVDQIKSIEHEIESAREEGTLEERQAKYRERLGDLAAEREQDYEKAVGKVLADFIQKETQDQGLPPVFHRARELFGEITDFRYELTLDRGSASFRASDRVYERSFALDELSSGTKVQLMLSVRMAFLETQEQACRAPLVLDETLANSDADRARAIIDAVKTICEEGRQVLYLTAQADEVQKWNAQLDGEEGPNHTIISLEEVDARELIEPGGDGAVVPARRVPESLPDPEATTHGELQSALDVPRWSPRQPVGRLHLWYLIESPEPLVELIESGTRTWGQLENRHQIGGVAATPFGEQAFGRVQARAQAVAAWKEAWHVGRGRPVDRPALEETDAVTDTFIDGVAEIANELDGDAETLLQVIRERDDERVHGFYENKADDLENYLLENGYLTEKEPLSEEEMWQRVLADLTEERTEGLISEDELERQFRRIEAAVKDA